MTDEQVWEDLSRFALAMKRGATVVFNDGAKCPSDEYEGAMMCFNAMRVRGGIREIIEPPQKKIRPLNAEEWRDVAGCIVAYPPGLRGGAVNGIPNDGDAECYAHYRATCHPPGFPSDVRKLWVEE